MVKVRPAVADDMAFIYSTWLKGQHFGNETFKEAESTSFYKNYGAFISSILALPGITVSVACLDDSPDVIVAYSVFSYGCVYWVYTKAPWRKKKIASMLLPDTINTVASLTKVGNSIRKAKGWSFDPWKGFGNET